MKFRLLTLALLCCGAAATAQNPYIALEGAAESAAGIAVSMPRSVLAVDLSVECSTVLCGPYARYAQKYLGVRAPLTDKTTWSIAGARIALAGDDAFPRPMPPASFPMRLRTRLSRPCNPTRPRRRSIRSRMPRAWPPSRFSPCAVTAWN